MIFFSLDSFTSMEDFQRELHVPYKDCRPLQAIRLGAYVTAAVNLSVNENQISKKA